MIACFYTLGCKVNQYESDLLAQRFAAEGFQVCENGSGDVLVINSCTVTAEGDRKTRQLLRRLRRENPEAIIALTGCFPQAFPEQASALEEADIVTGAKNRAALTGLVARVLAGEGRIVQLQAHEAGETFEEMSPQPLRRTRAFVKIEDGCDRHCAYCIIPTARGPVRSKPLEALRQELAELAQAGHREVVLSGVNLSCYGQDSGTGLLQAVALACGTPGLQRVRLGSLEPDLLTPDDIEALAKLPGLCPHFHLSLQSGCDTTLQRMHRRYDTAHYRSLAEHIRRCFANPAITTDIMAGFPGESEQEFAYTLAFVEEMAFAGAHVFPYSRRPGTPAADMPGQLARQEKAERAHRLLALTRQSQQAFWQGMVGRTEQLLPEQSNEPGCRGYTANYTPVHLLEAQQPRGKMIDVLITGVTKDCCTAILCP